MSENGSGNAAVCLHTTRCCNGGDVCHHMSVELSMLSYSDRREEKEREKKRKESVWRKEIMLQKGRERRKERIREEEVDENELDDER